MVVFKTIVFQNETFFKTIVFQNYRFYKIRRFVSDRFQKRSFFKQSYKKRSQIVLSKTIAIRFLKVQNEFFENETKNDRLTIVYKND